MPFIHAPVIGASFGSMMPDAAWKLVLHTTEGDTLSGALRTYAVTGLIPHVTAAPKERRAVQHLDYNLSGSALRHLTGTVETNRARAIQVEIVGRAATIDTDLTSADHQWLWDEVIVPLCAEKAIPLVALEFHAYPPPMRLGTEPWRMTPDEWLAFSGICGHQHVPGNVHGDPGALTLGDDMPTADEVANAVLAKLQLPTDGFPIGTASWAGVWAATLDASRITATGIAAVLARAPGDIDVGELAAMLHEGLGDEVAAKLAADLAQRLAS